MKVDLYNGSDIAYHLPYLRKLAAECDSVLEFGVRCGESTKAFASSVKHLLISVDINYSFLPEVDKIVKGRGIEWNFLVSSSLDLHPVFDVDMLFIDSKHTYEHAKKELELFGNNVRKYIGLHDTYLFGDVGEDGSTFGLVDAILDFTSANPHWSVYSDSIKNNGLTILKRKE